MKHITIDTNFFQSYAFNFDIKFFTLLKRLINDKEVNLVLSSVVDSEIKDHYRSEIENKVSSYNSNLKTLKKTLKGFISYNEINKTEAIEYGLNLYEKFKKELNVEIASVDNVVPSEVFSDFFAKKGAFSQKKKSEFKDSFAYKSLKNYLKEEKLYVLSKDNDWMSMATEYGDDLFDDGDKLLKKLFSFDDHIELICNKFIKGNKKLISEIEDDLLEELKICNYYDDEIEPESYGVEKIEVSDTYIVDKDDDTNTIELEVNFRVEANQEIIYDDYDNAVWDSVDKEYAYLPKGHSILTHIIKPSVSVVLCFHEEDGDIVIDSYNVVEKTISIDYEDASIRHIFPQIDDEFDDYREYLYEMKND